MKAGPLSIPARLRSHWRLKCALSVVLSLAFCVPYFTLQRVTFFPVRRLPLTALDRLVAFQPRWVYAYQSIYLLFPTTAWLASTRGELARYARGFLALSLAGFAFFLLLPVEGPRPVALPADGMLRLLHAYDRPLNAFPSLHVGLAVYTVLFGRRILTQATPGVRMFLVVEWAWVVLIAYSTLATKQHYAIDLPAGALLAWAADAWAWRSAVGPAVPAAVPSMAEARPAQLALRAEL